MYFCRWKQGEPRRVRTFPPLAPDHPGVDEWCLWCSARIGTATRPVLIAVGPTTDEDLAKHAAGRWYSCGAVLLHERCADYLTEQRLGELVDQLTISEDPEVGT